MLLDAGIKDAGIAGFQTGWSRIHFGTKNKQHIFRVKQSNMLFSLHFRAQCMAWQFSLEISSPALLGLGSFHFKVSPSLT